MKDTPFGDSTRTAISRLSNVIDRFNALISTSAGTDAVLATIEYASYSFYHSLPFEAPQKSRHGRPEVRMSLVRSSDILAISSLASDTRQTLRLFGLIRLASQFMGLNRNPARDPWVHALARLQIFMLVWYQLLENMAHLSAKGVLSKSFEKYGNLRKWYIWSARFLLGGVVLQLFKLWREYSPSNIEHTISDLKREGSSNLPDNDQESKVWESETKTIYREWRKDLAITTTLTPLCIHWAMDGGIGIPATVVGILGFLAASMGLRDLWGKTKDI